MRLRDPQVFRHLFQRHHYRLLAPMQHFMWPIHSAASVLTSSFRGRRPRILSDDEGCRGDQRLAGFWPRKSGPLPSSWLAQRPRAKVLLKLFLIHADACGNFVAGSHPARPNCADTASPWRPVSAIFVLHSGPSRVADLHRQHFGDLIERGARLQHTPRVKSASTSRSEGGYSHRGSKPAIIPSPNLRRLYRSLSGDAWLQDIRPSPPTASRPEI